MNSKTSKIKQATQDIKGKKITLYHIVPSITDKDAEQIKTTVYFNPSKNALGGQSDGYYFFTTKSGVENHIKNMHDAWDTTNNKHAYIIECEIDSNDIKYPNWKLDYESMQDFLFDMIYKSANKQTIKIKDIEITALDNKKLSINKGNKFSRIQNFTANDHSGLIELISDYLYKHDPEFKKSYDELLSDVFHGNGENLELFAVKTTTKHKITKITKIENEPASNPPAINSQINKFFARYGKARR